MPETNVFRSLKARRKKKKGLENDNDEEEPTGELFSTAGDYGLRTVAEGETDTVDIVFVHGLTGNRESTWTHKNSIFWPKDLLAKDLQNVRIFTFGYDADVVKLLKIAGGNMVRDHGKSLAQDLSLRRAETNTTSRPVIFVAHSLGGLVVEQALLISRGTSEHHVKTLLINTTAIAFMGTPQLGSGKADRARPLNQLISLVRRTNKGILAVLEPGSEMLAQLQQDFFSMLEDRRRNEGKWIEIFSFYEELSYVGIGDIVPRQSAILPEYPNAAIHQNHSDMTKFSGATDPGYVRVKGQLWLWVDAINKRELSATATIPVQTDSDERTLVSQTNESEQASVVPVEAEVSAPVDSGERQSAQREAEVSALADSGERQPAQSESEVSESANSGERQPAQREEKTKSSQAGAISSRGGPIFMGNVSAGRDFRYTQH